MRLWFGSMTAEWKQWNDPSMFVGWMRSGFVSYWCMLSSLNYLTFMYLLNTISFSVNILCILLFRSYFFVWSDKKKENQSRRNKDNTLSSNMKNASISWTAKLLPMKTIGWKLWCRAQLIVHLNWHSLKKSIWCARFSAYFLIISECCSYFGRCECKAYLENWVCLQVKNNFYMLVTTITSCVHSLPCIQTSTVNAWRT